MSTPDSIKTQIQNLISTANTTTGKSDTNLTTAITSLISGYGGGGDDYDFWEIYQQGGSRTDYSFAFNGFGWTDDVFKPKYIIKPIIAQNMLSNGCKITVINDENFDFSECTNAINLCYLSTQIREANIDISNITNFTGGFYYSNLLHSITLRNINNTCTFANSFYSCGSLVNFNMTGMIGKSISFANSPLLSNTSIQNIIEGLEDLTEQTAQTLTFHKDIKAKLTEEQISTITSKNWTLA